MSNSAMKLVIASSSDDKIDSRGEQTLLIKESNDVEVVSKKDIAISWLVDNIDELKNIIEGSATKSQFIDCCTKYFLIKRIRSDTYPKVDSILIESTDNSIVERGAISKFIDSLPTSSILDRLKYICPRGKVYPVYLANNMEFLLLEYDAKPICYSKEVVENTPGIFDNTIKRLTFNQYVDLLAKDINLLSEYVECMNFWERRAFKQEIKIIDKLKTTFLQNIINPIYGSP